MQGIENLPFPAITPKSGYAGAERRVRKPVLGMRIRDFDAVQSARHMLVTTRTAEEGLGLFITPNIQHIALAREDEAFRAALESAQIIVADGFPVFRFAKLRGLSLPGRIAGREVIEQMFDDSAALVRHRGYFIVDTEETAALIRAWAAERFPGFACRTHVPPFGFDRDVAQCAALADDVTRFETSLLFLCIGAPKSEMFAHRYRMLLPPCWALCVGQSFRLILGTTPPPPALMVKLNLEWLWRIMLEPRRMMRRYGPSMVGFLRAVATDLKQP